eukprot:CAMPEP_0197824460 /NCGR_PEP_ID=MMETSP1437-20131217/1692_1 /TAXON_ID=49252 ORGANISM="Eucampia antarctica, Strain CCMP1452" /NCGR_SAMPLE_ID=MMETSP1437 /ASSEMBLY_ACC=CAM_ASM_001096 /LENGTH=316 /DNA_ID=CAMNT_0043424085 /DNA_START=150 /DNA_END=1100 /DNA_ORIENTATION=+
MSTTTTSSSSFHTEVVPGRVALLQFRVTDSKQKNHETATIFIARAAESGAQLAVLPEIWNSPYATAAFGNYAEQVPEVGEQQPSSVDSPSIYLLVQLAKEHSIYIVGGSIPEISKNGKMYNTCVCVDPSGTIVAKHRKVHLFDIDVPGGICFKESDTLSPGNDLTYFNAGEPLGNVGVGICYDIRFPEYALLLCKKYNCNVLIYPGAFNLTTGPAHWELLQRGRAVDNQCFILTASPARTEPPSSDDEKSKYPHYTAWGHSTAVSPWGDVIASCDENENIVTADLDMTLVSQMRQGIPILQQKRGDLYEVNDGEKN